MRKVRSGIGIVGLFNIQFIVDKEENVYIIEVNPRSSRTVPFLSKATGYSLADVTAEVILRKELERTRHRPDLSGRKETMVCKSTGIFICKIKWNGCLPFSKSKSARKAVDIKKLHRAMYKAMIASGIRVQNYGTVIVTLADEDKKEALPFIRRFYNMGFNIEATSLTADYLKKHGIRIVLRKPSEEVQRYWILSRQDM